MKNKVKGIFTNLKSTDNWTSAATAPEMLVALTELDEKDRRNKDT